MEKAFKIKQKELPLIPLRGMTVYPNMVIHFDVGREKSTNAIEAASLNDSELLLCTQKDPKIENPKWEDFYHIGTIAKVKQLIRLPGGAVRVLVEGINRGKISQVIAEDEYFEVIVDEYKYEEDKLEKSLELEAIVRIVEDDFETYTRLNERISPEELITIKEIDDPSRLADLIASLLYLKAEKSQKIIEAFNVQERLEVLHIILSEEIEILKIEKEIINKVQDNISKVQREHYLKEQIKVIQEELGQGETVEDEVDRYIDSIKKIKFEKEIEDKLIKEAERLLSISANSSETGVIRNYLDWIIDLPWNEEREEIIDLKSSKEILNKDHYGLEDIKERILEFIAVRKLTSSVKGPILCLVGPPGVGKTSIAKSVAKSLNKDFVRLSLGGVRDEAEIRGHRRTYVGAMPGSIISSMKKAGSKNPVFLLDEIDKVGNDYRGDPASALLEVLDPEQNKTYTDHFLDLPFDLSKVLFLTTANTTSTIPPALLDRMEVIEVSSYTEEEKLQIAIKYLLPKQLKEHGLKAENIQISDQAIKDIISGYTREAGVRNLERKIASICRKAAKRIVEENLEKVRITTNNIENYLGTKYYKPDSIFEENMVGIANGLAWTSVGGTTLSIEVNSVDGTGKVQLTGKLGDVMKESAMAAISFIRSYSDKLNIEKDFYEKKDIHIHVPEGATPKDGPSAGITMATAVISDLTNIPINREVAMTGEITIRGRVLPVGGIKEKVLAANRLGIKKIILPKENKKDLDEIPSRVRNGIEFVLVDSMEEVLKEALIDSGDNNESN